MNKRVFASRLAPLADTTNEAGGTAYQMDAKNALAQLACTGTIAGTFYASAEGQLDQVLKFAAHVDDEFIGKLAVYARRSGYMKDMPAVLCALLARTEMVTMKKARLNRLRILRSVFPKVIDNGKMLRNFCQAIRSGMFDRRSFGTVPKALVREFLERKPDWLFRNSYGNKPSMADVIKMVHPKPKTKAHSALFAYLIGKKYTKKDLPMLAKTFESFKDGKRKTPPELPFPMIAGLELSKETWTAIARSSSWQSTRMNLNTFLRHGVFEDEEVVEELAAKLSCREEIQKARCFPYQLLMAYTAANDEMPHELTEALQDAMEIAVENTPALEGVVYVCPDVSGSMGSSATGMRQGATSAVRCVDIAALYSAVVLRRNPRAHVLPFDLQLYGTKVSGRDSIMTTAHTLARYGGGGTACSLPLTWLNQEKKKVDTVIYVSDNESWAAAFGQRRPSYLGYSGRQPATSMMEEWAMLKKRCPKARLVCIDIQPYTTHQVKPRDDTLLVGGFSDAVFNVVASWLKGSGDWIKEIERTEI